MITSYTDKHRQTNKWIGVLLITPFLLYSLTFFVLPLCSVVSLSTHVVDANYEVVQAWSLENFASALSAENLPILLRSVGYATITTALCLALGFPLAWFIARHGGRYKTRLLALLMLPFWTSYLIRIFAWMTILQSDGILNWLLLSVGIIDTPLNILNTPFSVIIGLTYGFLPFATLPIYSTLEKLDDSILEAAADLGATPVNTFLRVVLPISVPGIAAGCVLTFVPAMGDFVTPELLGGVDTMMVGNLIQQQYLAAFNWPFGAALSLIIMALMLCFILAFLKVSGSRGSLV